MRHAFTVSAHLRVRRAAAALAALRAWPPQVQLHWSDPERREARARYSKVY